MSMATPLSGQDLVNYLQGQIYTWAGIAVGVGVALVVVVSLVLWKNHGRTKTSKLLDSVKGKPVQLLLAASLGPFAKLLRGREFNPEGVLETKKFKDRAKGRDRRRIFKPPSKIDVGTAKDVMSVIDFPAGTDDAKKIEVAELTKQLAQTMINLSNEKVYLERVGAPISVAVEDKVITANITGLGAIEFYRKLELVQTLEKKIKSLKESEDYRDVGSALEYLLSKISLVPFNMIRAYFDESYDQSNEEAQNEWHHMQGFRDGVASVKKGNDNSKLFLYGGLAMIIGGCAIAAIGLFLGK